MKQRIEGQCECGAFRYGCTLTNAELVACGCLECRRATAAGQTKVLRALCQVLEAIGPYAVFEGDADGRHISHGFCEVCGSRLYYRDDIEPDSIFLSVDHIVSQRGIN